MYTFSKHRAEGPKDDYTVLGEPKIIESGQCAESLAADLEYEVKRLREIGAEVVKKDDQTYLVIDEDDTVTAVLTIA